MENKYIVQDVDGNWSYGSTPEKAIQQYCDEFAYFDVKDLNIYQLTNLKAKSNIVITGTRDFPDVPF